MLLEIDNLSIQYYTPNGVLPAVRNVSLSLEAGETLGIVGESGCGKSTLAYALLGYLAPNAKRMGGEIRFRKENLFAMSTSALAAMRGKRIAMVPQNPQSSLNPALKIGTQIAEVINHHSGLRMAAARREAICYLEMVNIPDPVQVALRYPHELSGGQNQRVSIAIALCLNPDLLVMDEPTTNLDVTTEAVVLDLISELKKRVRAGIVYISHNLAVIARISDRVAVMYAGEVLEETPVTKLFRKTIHPYTKGLLGCIPRPGLTKRNYTLVPISGSIPRLTSLPAGCVFAPRCSYTEAICIADHPQLESVAENQNVRCVRWKEVLATEASASPLLEAKTIEGHCEKILLGVRGLRKTFGGHGTIARWIGAKGIQAVAGVDLELPKNSILGLVGESGSGKTTLLRCVAGIEASDEGTIIFNIEDISRPIRHRPSHILKQIQVVLQDPESTLNPRYTIGKNLVRHLKCLRRDGSADFQQIVREALKAVRLDLDYFMRYPLELSGGEKQRVSIARAFLGQPDLVLCDEPLSSLDVSVQAFILRLLLDLQNSTGVSYLFISHNLAVVRYLADRIAVMYLGRLVEIGDAESFDEPPYHPYSEALRSAMSWPDPSQLHQPIRLQGAIPSPANPPSGCVFHTRCPRKLGIQCETELPPWYEVQGARRYRCHIKPDDLLKVQTGIDD